MTHQSFSTIGMHVQGIEDIRENAPAVFTGEKDPNRSKKYTFVSTEDLLRDFVKLGWDPRHVRQSSGGRYNRHIIGLENPKVNLDIGGDKIKSQLLLDNSHNGRSSAQIHMGLLREICVNGMVASIPGMYTNIKFRHVGVDFEELRQLMSRVAEQYMNIGSHIQDMGQVDMADEQKQEFVRRAIAARDPQMFVKDDGTIDVSEVESRMNPEDLLAPIRDEDKGDNLWRVYNVIQERLVKAGELYPRWSSSDPSSRRRSNTKMITNVRRNVMFNRQLWEIAEDYMPEDAKLVATE